MRSANPLSVYRFEPLDKIDLPDRSGIRISPQSKYEDLAWNLSSFEQNPHVKASSRVLRFDFSIDDGTNFSESIYDSLRETFKAVIYGMASSPKGKFPSPGTLKDRYTDTRFFMYWVIRNRIFKLSVLTQDDTDRYTLEVRQEDVHPMTKIGRLDVLKYVWQYRKTLPDPITFDPLAGQSSHAVSGVTRQQKKDHRYDFIPDDLAQKFIRACVTFIREKGVDVAVAVQARDSAALDQIRRGKSKANRDREKRFALEGTGFTNAEVTTLSRQLLTCCYAIINFFTGIRASEMLSMGPDQIYIENGITWVLGTQYKIQKRSRKWMAPNVVHEAHHLAKSLTQPMRDAIEYEIENASDRSAITQLQQLKDELFLSWSKFREHGYKFNHAPQVANIKGSIHSTLGELIELFDIVDVDGNYWRLHPHQFRKSFVRFMCSNSMNIRYLQEHMGHKSLDMTVWYDSDDIELTIEIAHQMREFKSQKIDAILNQGQKITGAGAVNMQSERKDFFVGLTSPKSKEAFIQNLADDITLRNTGHSWCMGDSGNGNCTGVIGCMADISMTQQCSSALITEEHLLAWQEIKFRNEKLLLSPDIGRYQKEAIQRVIRDTIDPTIHALTNTSEVSIDGR